MNKIILSCVAALAVIGCYPTQYTHIERADSGYVLTKNQAGFFRVHGEIWMCTPDQGGKVLNCHEASEK